MNDAPHTRSAVVSIVIIDTSSTAPVETGEAFNHQWAGTRDCVATACLAFISRC